MVVKGYGREVSGSIYSNFQAIYLQGSTSRLALSKGSVILGGLYFSNERVADDLLPQNTAFVRCTYDATTGTVTIPKDENGNFKFITEAHESHAYLNGDMTVVEHTHNFTDNGTCICGLTAAAEVKGNAYKTMTAAVKAAGDGDSVKLLADNAGLNETIIVTGETSLTIDLNGKTLKSPITVLGTLNLTNTAENNGSVESITLGDDATSGSLQILDNKVNVTDLTVANKPAASLTSLGNYHHIKCTGSGITLGDLLPQPGEDGKRYAFYKTGGYLRYNETELSIAATTIYASIIPCTNHAQWENGLCGYCGYVCPHDSVWADGSCSKCGMKLAALLVNTGESTKPYEKLSDAVAAASKIDGSILKLMKTDSESQNLETTGEWTLDMNGKTLPGTELTVSNGILTIQNLLNENTGKLKSVTVKSGGRVRVIIDSTNKTIEGIDTVVVENGGTACLECGTYGSIDNQNADGKLSDLLADRRAFANATTGDIINGYTTDKSATNIRVVEHYRHTINMEGGTCACGFKCNHENGFTNGVCPDCKTECPHTNVTKAEKGIYCDKCNQQMVVKVKKDGKTTYFAKQYHASGTDETLRNLLNGLESDSIVTLLEDNLLASGWVIGKNITLDLNGKNLIENNGIIVESENKATGKLTVTGSGSSKTPEDSSYPCTFRVSSDGELRFDDNFSGSYGTIYVEGGELNSTSTNMTFDTLEIQNSGATVSLKGGTFGKITGNCGKTLGDLLAEGYVFKKDGSYVVRDTAFSSQAVENVTVVKCTHEKIENVTVCPYCKSALTATVTKNGNTTGYTSAQEAVNHADSGTVKLLADVSESLEISSALKLDCNGHTIEKLTVSGNVTLESLLPEGYAFKSDDKWVSDISGTTLEKVTTAEAPVKSVTAKESKVTSTYGKQVTLEATVETTEENVEWKWYKFNNDIGIDVTLLGKYTVSFNSCKLPSDLAAGSYVYRLTCTKDGYSKSCEFKVTIEKADAKVTTAPTAKENLTYNATEQKLLKPGTTSDGTLVYSLTKDGTYEKAIPTGKDAGKYIVWYKVMGDKNHKDSEPKSVEVTIKAKELSISDFTIVAKTYDETTNAEVASVTFSGLENGDNPELGTDFTATAEFDNANAGENKSVTLTITTKETSTALKNYQLTKATLEKSGFAIAKAVPTVSANAIAVSYNGSAVSADKITGTATFNGKTVEGTWNWQDGEALTNVVDSGKKKVVFTPNDTTNFKPVETTLELTINKATPAGNPACDKVTASGKKLSEVKLSSKDADGKDLFTVSGTVAWENGDTEVKQGEKYKWQFTPTDTDNYTPFTGEIIPWEKPASSGGGAPATPADTAKDVTTDTKTEKTTSKTEVKVTEKANADGSKEKVAEVKVSADNQKEIIKQAKEKKSKEIILDVASSAVGDASKADVTLDKSFIDSIIKDTDASLTIKTPFGDKTYTQDELKALSAATAGNTVSIGVAKVAEPIDTTKTEKITKAKRLTEELNLVARSSKTAKKNVKVVLKKDKTCTEVIEELKELGFTVKYRFYRSTKKSAGYKSAVTKKTASYINTSGKKGTKYFYKVQVRVYDEKGKLIAKTALKQCKYASRTWSK